MPLINKIVINRSLTIDPKFHHLSPAWYHPVSLRVSEKTLGWQVVSHITFLVWFMVSGIQSSLTLYMFFTSWLSMKVSGSQHALPVNSTFTKSVCKGKEYSFWNWTVLLNYLTQLCLLFWLHSITLVSHGKQSCSFLNSWKSTYSLQNTVLRNSLKSQIKPHSKLPSVNEDRYQEYRYQAHVTYLAGEETEQQEGTKNQPLNNQKTCHKD